MSNDTAYFEQNIPEAFERRGVLAWLYWLHIYMEYWLGLSPRHEQGFAPTSARPAKRHINRHLRRVDKRFDNNTVPISRNIRHFRAMLPRGLSHTQYQEMLSRVAIVGRTHIYRIPNLVPLHRRMLFMRLARTWRGARLGRLLRALLAGLWVGFLRPN